jgi:O-antigen/teichoic acid export membrane protein
MRSSTQPADATPRSLQRSSLVYVVAAAVTALIPFAALPLLTRWMGPSEYGIAGTYLALVNLGAVIAGLSSHGVISVVHYRVGAEHVPAHVGACLKVLGLTAVPLAGALLLCSEPLYRVSGIPPAWSWTIALTAAAQFVVGLGVAVWQARTQALRVGTVQVAMAALWATSSLALVGTFGWGWEGRAAGQILAACMVAALALWLLERDGLLRWRSADNAPLQAALRFGLPLLPHSVAGVAMSSADRLIVSGLAGTEAAGLYFASLQIASVLTVGAAAVNLAWVPWLYRRLAARLPGALDEAVFATYCAFAVLLGMAALIAVNAPWLMTAVAGARYEAAAASLRWLAPAAALSGMYYFVAGYLFFAGRTGVLSIITVCCAGLQVGLIFLLVPRFGIEGAAAATLVAMLAYWVATWLAAQRVVPMPWFGRQLPAGSP